MKMCKFEYVDILYNTYLILTNINSHNTIKTMEKFPF